MMKNSNLLVLCNGISGIRISINNFLYSFLLSIALDLIIMVSDTYAGLTQEAIEDFHQGRGYVIVRQMYNPEEIKKISDCADRLEEEAEKLGSKLAEGTIHKVMHNGTQFVLENIEVGTAIHRIVWVGAAEPLLLELGRKKELLECVGQLLDAPKGDQLINQLHFKRPGKDKIVKFIPHQDIENRVAFDPDWKDINGKGSFVQTLIAVDEMTEENGPLKVIDGIPSEGNLGLKKITNKEELEITLGKYGSWKTITLKPGDVLFTHPLSVHKSEITNAVKPTDKRRLFINGFACVGANTKPYPGVGSCQIIDFPPVLKK